jgi:hypothetical protein
MDTRTHYLPAMTRRDGDQQQAICGAWTTAAQHRTDPGVVTCWGCKMWLENLDVIEPETAEELRTR